MSDRLDARQFLLLSATVAVALATHLPHLPPWLTLACAVLLPMRAWTRQRGAAAVSAWLRLPLAALLLVLVITHYGNVFGREPGSVLGCGLLALKLLETERVRDARVALGFAAFVLMSALLFTQTIGFTLAIVGALVLLVTSLASLQPAPLDPARPLPGQLRLALALLGVSLPLAAASFVLVPRLGSPLWGAPGADTLARTGLGDRMSPGQFTDLLVDDSPAMRVDFGGPPPPSPLRYFRAIVLWDFDGTTWSRGRGRGAWQTEAVDAPAGRFSYEVTLEPTDRHWLPTLDLPLDAPPTARFSADRVLVSREPVTQPRRYALSSATRYRLSPVLPAWQRQRALALPEDFDPRARALAHRWRAGGASDEAVVQAALALFHAEFTYTLSPPLLGRHSIDEFLFETRQGFCEHYSSAFVFLMRAAGIPARVVTGYQGGWWNPSGNYLLVRQSDAHAWAEVWSEGTGWRRVDPTAAVSPERIELGAPAANDNPDWSQASFLRSLRNQFDLANRLWTEGVIRFDALRQRGLLTRFGAGDANPGDLLLALSALLAFAMLVATVWALRAAGATPGDRLDRAWMRLRARLARRGIEPVPSEGPLDLLERVRRQSPGVARALAPLVHEYVQLRYAHAAAEPGRVAAFARAVGAFRARG